MANEIEFPIKNVNITTNKLVNTGYFNIAKKNVTYILGNENVTQMGSFDDVVILTQIETIYLLKKIQRFPRLFALIWTVNILAKFSESYKIG